MIDEYDVPLDKAFQNGYYREMVALIRALFGLALKTNDFLQFAVLTGFDCRVGIVIEVKYAEDGNLDAACKKALEQIEEKSYEARLQEDGMRTILKYGIACYKKDCRVAVKK